MAIQTLNTIKKWFKTGLKPTQDQFWNTWDSFSHKFEQIPLKDIEELETTLLTKAEKSQLEEHQNNPNAHAELFSAKENKSEKGIAGGYVPLNEFSKITHQYLDVVNNLTTGGETALLSAEQGVVLQNQIDNINTLLSSDNVDLDTIQKIVDIVEQIQMSLNNILVNDLTTGGVTKALTAEMGKLLETSKEDKSQKGIANGYAPLNDLAKIASQYLTIINDLTTGGTASILSAEQGVILQNQINAIHTLLSSDNVDLDTLQEIVDAIEEVQISLDTILVNDLTTGGATKALTAEMGKQLNEIKLTATIATDTETQTTNAFTEDYKVITRLKLFNWWTWLNSSSQIINGIWNFTKGLKTEIFRDGYTWVSQMTNYSFFVSKNTPYHYSELEISADGIRQRQDQMQSFIGFDTITQDNLLNIPNQSGTLALKNDLVKTAPGTTTNPPLIIPNGILTTVPQNGAIERDSSGQLWETNNGIRSLIGSKPASEMSSGTVELATDEETQIDTAVTEDNKVVSRSKLFNWWENIKTKTQTISATWNFSKGLKVNDTVSGNTTEMLQDMFVAQLDRQDNGVNKTEYRGETIKWITSDGWSTLLKPITPNQNRTLTLPNKSGTIAIINDYVKTASGTATTPSLIIPNGFLTTVPQNGAIERNENGELWETHNGIRNRIVTTDYVNSLYSSGTYTPSLENTLNITGATLISATYTKIDNIVNVMIALTATPVSFSDVQINISLPFNRNTSTSLLSGIATGATANSNFSAQVSVISESKAAILYKASTSGLSNIIAYFSYSIN